MPSPSANTTLRQPVQIDVGADAIQGELVIPESPIGVVLFAHGSGSSRFSPRNRFVAESLHDHGLATLLVDLLTPHEEQLDSLTAEHRFDIELLTDRLIAATDWLATHRKTWSLPIGYFGASTGAAAALAAAAQQPGVTAVVSRGGRPDLARERLPEVRAATLLIVGELDYPVIRLNREAYEQLRRAGDKRLEIVRNATHLFEEPGALAEVARLAGAWFQSHFRSEARAPGQATAGE
jgi:dienelactone hydrolase